MPDLSHFRIAVLATDGFEESELIEPVAALKDARASVTIASLQKAPIQGERHMERASKVPVDCTVEGLDPDEFDAVLLPGGAINADALRNMPEVQAYLQAMDKTGKPIAAICHAPWLLISAGLVQGRTLTSYSTIRDDIRNAGGTWLDQEVVEDDNWVTSRQPSDIPAFSRAVLELFARSAVHR